MDKEEQIMRSLDKDKDKDKDKCFIINRAPTDTCGKVRGGGGGGEGRVRNKVVVSLCSKFFTSRK